MKSGIEIHSAQLHAMCDGAKIRSRADIPTLCPSMTQKNDEGIRNTNILTSKIYVDIRIL